MQISRETMKIQNNTANKANINFGFNEHGYISKRTQYLVDWTRAKYDATFFRMYKKVEEKGKAVNLPKKSDFRFVMFSKTITGKLLGIEFEQDGNILISRINSPKVRTYTPDLDIKKGEVYRIEQGNIVLTKQNPKGVKQLSMAVSGILKKIYIELKTRGALKSLLSDRYNGTHNLYPLNQKSELKLKYTFPDSKYLFLPPKLTKKLIQAEEDFKKSSESFWKDVRERKIKLEDSEADTLALSLEDKKGNRIVFEPVEGDGLNITYVKESKNKDYKVGGPFTCGINYDIQDNDIVITDINKKRTIMKKFSNCSELEKRAIERQIHRHMKNLLSPNNGSMYEPYKIAGN